MNVDKLMFTRGVIQAEASGLLALEDLTYQIQAGLTFGGRKAENIKTKQVSLLWFEREIASSSTVHTRRTFFFIELIVILDYLGIFTHLYAEIFLYTIQ